MCGIIFSLSKKVLKTNIADKTRQLDYRGNDSIGYLSNNIGEYQLEFVHNHLCINGIPGSQPFNNNEYSMIVNGEIYNYKEIAKVLDYEFISDSDCEVLMPLYKKYGNQMYRYIEGQYSLVIIDKKQESLTIARDLIGITSLYIGYNEILKDGFSVASELKCLTEYSNIEIFKPKTFLNIDLNKEIQFNFEIYNDVNYKDLKLFSYYDESILRTLLESSVQARIPIHCDYGFLLSGGLDSSLIAYIGSKLSKKKIKTFSIGLSADSPDLKHARIMAKFLNSEHNEILFSIEEGIESLGKVIFHIESYDTTTVRSSTPMYLIGKKIKELYPDLKVLLSGEGSDELFGGYLYFKNSPSSIDFHNECVDRTFDLHKYDCLRAHKSLLASGIECRVPFLDSNFVDYALKIDPFLKSHNDRQEKYILRNAFNNELPNEILWRVKDQFSDAVGYSWISELKEYAYNYKHICNIDDTLSNEDNLYKYLYYSIFNTKGINLIKKWEPKWSETKDPSGQFFLDLPDKCK
jgi:asparagine synthase (glutamine-hydrolysing)